MSRGHRTTVRSTRVKESPPSTTEVPRTYRPGDLQVVRWLGPVATHSLPVGEPLLGGLVERSDAGLRAVIDTFVDRKDRTDDSYGGDHQMRLLRDGELVGESADRYGEFELPDGPATLRLELESSRSLPWWRYSTQISSAWTFRSTGAGSEEKPERLPLLLVNYDVPKADLANRVPAGQPVELQLELRHQARAQVSPIAAVKLELSYDDGATWQSVPVKPTGAGTLHGSGGAPVKPCRRSGHAYGSTPGTGTATGSSRP